MNVEKQPSSRPKLVRSMPASKKPPAGILLAVPAFGVYGHGELITEALTTPQTSSDAGVEAAEQSTPLPPGTAVRAPLCHFETRNVLITPPLVKFTWTRTSPSWWTPLKVPFAFSPMAPWRNQK